MFRAPLSVKHWALASGMMSREKYHSRVLVRPVVCPNIHRVLSSQVLANRMRVCPWRSTVNISNQEKKKKRNACQHVQTIVMRLSRSENASSLSPSLTWRVQKRWLAAVLELLRTDHMPLIYFVTVIYGPLRLFPTRMRHELSARSFLFFVF